MNQPKMKPKNEKQLYSVREASEILSMSQSWIDNQIRDNKIASIMLIGKRMIRADELERIVKEGLS